MEFDWIAKWWGVITTVVALLATGVMLWLSKTFARREELKEVSTAMDELTTRVHALDRVLRGLHFWVPQWFKGKHTVAYWDMYAHPETLPPYSLGELDFWWYDADKAAKLKEAGAIR